MYIFRPPTSTVRPEDAGWTVETGVGVLPPVWARVEPLEQAVVSSSPHTPTAAAVLALPGITDPPLHLFGSAPTR